MSAFLCKLQVSFMTDAKGLPLLNRDGKQLWQVEQDFAYASDVAKKTITVPAGFVTDFASVPRIPLVYDGLGDLFQRAAVVHDKLYSTGEVTRDIADQVLLEAMALDGVSWVKRKLVYAGVRVGGGSHFAQTYRP
jgi:hypothetical protein